LHNQFQPNEAHKEKIKECFAPVERLLSRSNAAHCFFGVLAVVRALLLKIGGFLRFGFSNSSVSVPSRSSKRPRMEWPILRGEEERLAEVSLGRLDEAAARVESIAATTSSVPSLAGCCVC
jgi:hypothetical protein